MKTKLYILVLFYAFGYLLICGYRSGAATGGYDCTGAETGLSNPAGCKTCHGSTATTGIAVNIELDSAGVPTTQYVGGGVYTVTLTGTNNSTFSLPGYGFQLGSIQGAVAVTTPVNVGTWSSTLPTGTRLANPSAGNYVVRMVEQSTLCTPVTGTGGTGSVYQKTFTWTAPAAGTGTISFWAVLNAVNNNGSSGSTDKWNIVHTVITELNQSTGLTELNQFSNLKVFPNPANDVLNVQLDQENVGECTLMVYATDGRQVYQNVIPAGSATAVQSINTSLWSSGVYRVVIQNNNGRKVVPFVRL